MTLSAWTVYACFTLISRFLPWFSLCTAAPPPQKIVSLPDFVWGEEAAVQRLKTWTRKGKFRLPSLPPTRKSRMGKWHSLAFAKLPIIIDFVGRGLLFHFILSIVSLSRGTSRNSWWIVPPDTPKRKARSHSVQYISQQLINLQRI